MHAKSTILFLLSFILAVLSFFSPWISVGISKGVFSNELSFTLMDFILNFDGLQANIFNFNQQEIYLIIAVIGLIITGTLFTLPSIKISKYGYFSGAFLTTAGILWLLLIQIFKNRIGPGAYLITLEYGYIITIAAGFISTTAEIIRRGG